MMQRGPELFQLPGLLLGKEEEDINTYYLQHIHTAQ